MQSGISVIRLIELKEIPDGVLEECNSAYKTVTFDNYGKPAPINCETKSLQYRHVIKDELVRETVYYNNDGSVYSGPYKEKVYIVTGYIVRGVFGIDDSVDVYEILPLGNMVRLHDVT